MKVSSAILVGLTILAAATATVLASPPDFPRNPTIAFSEKIDQNLISVEGRFGYGSCYTTHALGDTLLTGNGPVLEIFDAANPDEPVRLGSLLLHGAILSIHAEGAVAFVYSRGLGLALIDITNLSSPQIISVVDIEERVYEQAKQGDFLFLANGYSGLRIINVADPAKPIEIGTFLFEPLVFSVALDGDLAFLSCSNGGLRILDISDPAQPTEIGQDPALLGGHGLIVRGKHLFATDRLGLMVYDVSNPIQPLQVAGILNWFDCEQLVIRGNTVFLNAFVPSLVVAIDITDPEFPSVVGSLDSDFYYHLTSGSKWLYAAGGHDGFATIDVSSPENPFIVGSFDEHGIATAVGVHDGHAYLADLYDDLRILDVSDISKPRQVGTYPTPGGVKGIALHSEVAYLAARSEGIQVLDVSNPAAPMTIGSLPVGFGYDVAVRGDLAFGVGSAGLYIFDVTDPSLPRLLGNFYPGPFCLKADFYGDFVFLAQLEVGVHVIDVKDPTNPRLVTTIGKSQGCLGVTISGNHAYIPTGYDGVEGYDISNPLAPIFTSAATVDGYARDIAVGFPYAYVADAFNGLTVLDVRDPARIQNIGSFDIPAGLDDVFIVDGLVWAAAQETGMWILRPHVPVAVPEVRTSGVATLFAAVPNPFNPQTTLAFELSHQEVVKLCVFDLSGRLVRRLLDGEIVGEGRHETAWNGRNDSGRQVASGAYFYRLEVGSFSETKSMVLIK